MTQTSKVIFLNGPPRGGKDTLANALAENGVVKTRMSAPLKQTIHTSIGYSDLNNQYYDDVKDAPHEDFFGRTPREAYIHMAENHFKPLYGQDIYGKLWLRKHHDASLNPRIFSICDIGFEEEVMPIIKAVGMKNCVVIYIYRDGRSFVNDSRDYISVADLAHYSIHNHEDRVEEFTRNVVQWLRFNGFLPGTPGLSG